MRPTDQARRTIRRARMLLGALAVVVAVPVGLAAAAGIPKPETGSGTVRAVLLQPSPIPEIALVEAVTPTPARWSTPDGVTRTGLVWAEAGLTRGSYVTVAVDDQGQPTGPRPDVEDPTVTGLAAAIATVAACWALLVVFSVGWRARLAEQDDVSWTADWARVEPLWSGRAT